MNEEKMKKAFTDEIFVKSLLQLESVAEVQEFLKEKGVELSEDDRSGRSAPDWKGC